MSKNDAGGASDPKVGDEGKDIKDTVSRETYTRAMDELKTLQRQFRAIEDEKKVQNEQKLKEQNEWKTLAEQKEIELKAKSGELDELKTSLLDSVKLSAFQKHLGGKLRSDKYFDFVETDKIAYNPETRKVDEASVKAVIASFLKEHSHLVEFKGGKLPENAAKGGFDGSKKSSGEKLIEEMDVSELESYILRKSQDGSIKF